MPLPQKHAWVENMEGAIGPFKRESLNEQSSSMEIPKEPENRDNAAHGSESIFKVRTLKDALANKPSSPSWVIQDLLLKDSATLVSAHPHSMKSLSLLCACMEAVAKKQVWGRFDASPVTKSLFIETEDPEWMVEGRIRGLAEGLETSEELPGFFYCCTGPFDLIQSEESLTRILEEHRPDFAVLSTLQGLRGGRDWLRQDQMAPVNALFVKISRRYCPLIVVTHSPWSKRDRRAAGTITQAANFATNIHFQKSSGNQSFVHVVVDSKSGVGQPDFSLKLNTEGNSSDASAVRSLTFAGEGWPRGSQKDAIVEAIEDNPDVSNKDIAERVGCNVRYVQKIRKGLRADENDGE